jgi:diaminopimelate decarboxylase
MSNDNVDKPTQQIVRSHGISTRRIPTQASLEVSGMKMKHKGATQIHNIAKQIHEELTEEADIDITSVDIGSMAWVINQYDITRFDDDEYKSIKDIIPKIISDKHINQSFTILDIGSIIRQYRTWRRYLPNVEIFYAVKCNPDPMILRTLANLGVGFDVASNVEINMALETDVDNAKIIYAHPCKRDEFISYARSQNVSMMTFDNKNELLKIALRHPTAKLVLRIVVDDITNSKMKFGCKYGCPMSDVEDVLNFAKFHKLNVVGVSFHVGSACFDSRSYYNSIKRSREVFDIAKKFDYNCNILDIGGGFPGSSQTLTDSEKLPTFVDMAEQIQDALKTFFADVSDLRVIAEPGRFFATSAVTHVVRISSSKSIYVQNTGSNEPKKDMSDDTIFDSDIQIQNKTNKKSLVCYSDSDDESEIKKSKKRKRDKEEIPNQNIMHRQNGQKVFHYYIDSNLYGVFNNLVFDQASVKFHLLNNYDDGGSIYPSVIFGETCDSLDKIVEGIELPELVTGDYLYVENHGAYTTASASAFNGFVIGKPVYIFTF